MNEGSFRKDRLTRGILTAKLDLPSESVCVFVCVCVCINDLFVPKVVFGFHVFSLGWVTVPFLPPSFVLSRNLLSAQCKRGKQQTILYSVLCALCVCVCV